MEMFESSIHTPELNLTRGEDGSGRTAGATVTAVVHDCKNCVLNVRMAGEGYQMCSRAIKKISGATVLCLSLSPGSDGHMCQWQLWAGCT